MSWPVWRPHLISNASQRRMFSQETLRELYENPAAPYEEDEVTRINIDGLNRKIFGEIAGWTVSDLREWLLSYEADNEAIHRISRGLTAEMVASVCKLMTNLDLIYAAQKIRVTAHCQYHRRRA